MEENSCGPVSAAIMERIIQQKPLYERALTEEDINTLRITYTLQIL